MKFYIVTPTFNALEWLKRCVRSVADQVGDFVEVHHHVQDGASTDGSPDWLLEWQQRNADIAGYTFTFESATDSGMYDAINKAWDKMPSDAAVTAHLNSDEQYLPGALQEVSAAFERHEWPNLVLGTYIIVDEEGKYICHRRPIRPAIWRSQTICEIITCSCFHEVAAFKRHGIRFDVRYKALADLLFFRSILAVSPRICVKPNMITSVFAVTGSNLAWSGISRNEWDEEMARLPWCVSKRHGIAYRYNNLLRFLTDMFCASPSLYAIYKQHNDDRTECVIKCPTSHWGMRTKSHEID